jgi:hypothetical protein
MMKLRQAHVLMIPLAVTAAALGRSAAAPAPATAPSLPTTAPAQATPLAAPATQAAVTPDWPPSDPPNRTSLIGGSRSAGETITVAAITTERPGLTVSASPILYWYLSNPTHHRIEIAMTRVDQIEPVLEFSVDGSNLRGVQKIDLAQYHISLQGPSPAGSTRVKIASGNAEFDAGPVYEWVVAIVENEQHRSNDVAAAGLIQRIAAPPTLAPELSNAGPSQLARAAVYAKNGLWYDTFNEVSIAIRQHPADSLPRECRRNLLQRINLTDKSWKHIQTIDLDASAPQQ